MFDERPHSKSMMLTPQEAMDLLDLCVFSPVDTDPDKDRIIEKLTAFVRHCLLDEPTVCCQASQL